MGFELDTIVPWGRSFDEYVAMFGLTARELAGRLLGCGDGPASFNAELTRRGGQIVSLDPIYAFTDAQIRARIDATYDVVLGQLAANRSDYVWSTIASVEELGRMRMDAMNVFLSDYVTGKRVGRYIQGELPRLPFPDARFDIALSSHLLFLYSVHLDVDFHVQSVDEMLRVAAEVRIFPLLSLDGTRSPHLSPVIDHFAASGCDVSILSVNYEFQRGANQLLRIRK